jgi:hypothetical protein
MLPGRPQDVFVDIESGAHDGSLMRSHHYHHWPRFVAERER